MRTLVETGFNRAFDQSVDAVRRVLDPTTLRYIVIPHFEGDECGALNRFLEIGHAVPVRSPGRRGHQLPDFAIRQRSSSMRATSSTSACLGSAS